MNQTLLSPLLLFLSPQCLPPPFIGILPEPTVGQTNTPPPCFPPPGPFFQQLPSGPSVWYLDLQQNREPNSNPSGDFPSRQTLTPRPDLQDCGPPHQLTIVVDALFFSILFFSCPPAINRSFPQTGVGKPPLPSGLVPILVGGKVPEDDVPSRPRGPTTFHTMSQENLLGSLWEDPSPNSICLNLPIGLFFVSSRQPIRDAIHDGPTSSPLSLLGHGGPP